MSQYKSTKLFDEMVERQDKEARESIICLKNIKQLYHSRVNACIRMEKIIDEFAVALIEADKALAIYGKYMDEGGAARAARNRIKATVNNAKELKDE